MSKRIGGSEKERRAAPDCDDQWVAWTDETSEVEWARVALAGFGEAASRIGAIRAFTRAVSGPAAH